MTCPLWGFACRTKSLVIICIISWVLIGLYFISSHDFYAYEGVYFPYDPSSNVKKDYFPSTDVKYQYQSEYKRVLEKQKGLQEMCDTREVWRGDVYIDCYRNLMGAFNAINRVQVCIRWAMDAGVGLIEPQFWKRVGLVKLDDETAGTNELSYILDAEFLWKTLQTNCPQLRVAKLEDLKNRVEIHTKYIIHPDHQLQGGDYKNLVEKLISDHKRIKPKEISDDSTIIIKQWDSLCGWKVYSDPLSFQISFKELFLFKPSIIQLALKMLYKLPQYFMGVHLRAEADWLELRNSIGEIILDKIEDRRLNDYPVIYVACGDVKQLNRFMNMAGERGMKIATKWSIANERETKELQSLEFDQMAIVDYIILNHAKYFYGDGMSSFSFALGITRHLEQFGNLNYSGRDEDQYLLGQIEQMFVNNVGLW